MRKSHYITLLITCVISALFLFNLESPIASEGLGKKKLRVKNTKERDRPDLAVAQEIEMTKSPVLGYPPTYKKIAAFEETKRMLQKKANKRAIDGVHWTERGPSNVGGRTRALMFDPNDPTSKKAWAGAVAGGIWYNNDITDAQSEWQNVDDFMANIAISAIAYDPQKPNIFYAGTGLLFTNDVRGAGLYKSEDGGVTWSHLASTMQPDDDSFYYTQKIIVTASSKVIAATSAGIKISIDQGASWIHSTLDESITDLELAADGTLFASNYSGDIYRSYDEGETWSSVLSASGYRVELATAPSDPLVVYAVSESNARTTVGYFKKSIDGGETWNDITIPKYQEQSCQPSTSDFTRGQAFFDLILAVFPDNADKVIVGGIDLHISKNGGSSWDMVSYWTGACADYVHADQHAIVFKENSGTTALFGNDGGVYYSETLDKEIPKFEQRINGYNTALFYACAANNEVVSNIYLAGSQDNGSQMFSSHEINQTMEVTGGDGAYCFIDQDNPKVMITSYVYNSYYRSLDGGQTFTSFVNTQDGSFINPADYDDEADILYTAHNTNSMAVYGNMAGTTVSKSVKNISINGKISHISVSPYSDNRVFIGLTSGRIFIIDEANTTPEIKRIDNDQLPSNAYVSSIEIGESDNHLLVTYSNYDVTSVWETKDGGENWVNKEGNLPNMPIRWALLNPENRNEALLATEFGVWSTDDISADVPLWEPTVEGLANVKCMMLQYRESDQQVVVATFGRGLFTTNIFTKDTYPDFASDIEIGYVGQKFNFKNYTVGKADNYLWDFGDGNSSSDKNAFHTFTSPGTYSISLSTNGQGQKIIKNNYIHILPNREGDYSLNEGGDFDTYSEDFLAVNLGGTPFELGNSNIQHKDGTTSGDMAWVTGIDAKEYSNNSTAILYSPHFDLSIAGSYELSFKTKFKFEDEWDGFIVEYTLDSGKTWTKLKDEVSEGWYNSISDPQSVFGVSVPIFSGESNGFETKTVDISHLSGKGRAGFRVVFKSDAAVVDVGMVIEDFFISGVKTNASPDFSHSFNGGNTCNNSVITFYDNSSGSISEFLWEFGEGATPATAIGRGPHQVTYSTTGFKTVGLTVEGELNSTQTNIKPGYINITGSNINDKNVIVSSNSLCINEQATVTVENADSGFTYQLFNASSDLPLGQPIEGNGGDIIWETGTLSESTSYYVQVIELATSCSSILSTQPEIAFSNPVMSTFSIGNNEVCEGSATEITLGNTEAGVSYYLYDLTNQSVFSEIYPGNDESLVLTSFPIPSTIDLQVVAEKLSCSSSSAPFKVIIKTQPNPTIIADGSTLICTDTRGSRSWFLNGEKIFKYTESIEAIEYGEYTVEVMIGGCTAVSEPYSPLVLSVSDLMKSGTLKVFPNPTTGFLNINQKGDFNGLRIYSITGKIVMSKDVLFQNEVINLLPLESGQYIVELLGKSGSVKMNIQKL